MREIEAIINKKTGQVIHLPPKDRPTVEAYINFKRPVYNGTALAAVGRKELTEKGSKLS